MKRGSTLFLKIAIVLIALAALGLLIRFPLTEGRAKDLDLLSIYSDPFIIYMYVASIPFFVTLFHAFTLLRFVDKNNIFSEAAVKTVTNIQYCATAIVAFVVGSVGYLFVMERGNDDIAGGVAGGLLIIFVSVVIATGAAIFKKLLQNAVDLKSENDLTV